MQFFKLFVWFFFLSSTSKGPYSCEKCHLFQINAAFWYFFPGEQKKSRKRDSFMLWQVFPWWCEASLFLVSKSLDFFLDFFLRFLVYCTLGPLYVHKLYSIFLKKEISSCQSNNFLSCLIHLFILLHKDQEEFKHSLIFWN